MCTEGAGIGMWGSGNADGGRSVGDAVLEGGPDANKTEEPEIA